MALPSLIRIGLCDDQQLILDSLAIVLSKNIDIEVAGTAHNGYEALELAHHNIDLILMDIRMPEMDGIMATQRLKTSLPGVKIIALTTFADQQLVRDCLNAGADSYVLKDISADNLASVIRLVMANHAIWPAFATSSLRNQAPSFHSESPVTLSMREQDVLKCLASGMSNKELADFLHITESTAKNHLSNIYNKFNVRDRIQALVFALAHNLIQLNDLEAQALSRWLQDTH